MENKSKKTRNIIGIALGILIVLVAWSMVTAMGSKEKPEPDDNKHLGIAEYEKGNHNEAIKYYNKGIEANPGDSCLFNNRGLAYYELRKYDEAISDFNKAIELKPVFAEAFFNRGRAYWRQGGYNKTEFLDKAVSDFSKVIESNPDDMEAYYNRGLAYSSFMHWHKKKISDTKRSGFTPEATYNFVKALFDFQKVIDSDSPYSALAIAGKANLFYRHANWEV
ncbi:MAG: tetratricopeptide repeat protein, partial [Desulfobacterales bacterium]